MKKSMHILSEDLRTNALWSFGMFWKFSALFCFLSTRDVLTCPGVYLSC